MNYVMQKHIGELPLIGVNTFLSSNGSPTILPQEVIRSTTSEKDVQINNLQQVELRNKTEIENQLFQLKQAALENENLFDILMQAAKYCSLGQITHALFEVGGQYRRNM